MDPNYKTNRKAEIKRQIERLAEKIVSLSDDVIKFGPKRYRKGLKIVARPRSGMQKHWHRMALKSLRATRKKIYRLQEELKGL